MKNEIQFTRINNDVNGNPRYVCHYLNLLNDSEKYNSDSYAIAVKKANKIGGRKYHTKRYGGGVVFQSYNIETLANEIISLQSI